MRLRNNGGGWIHELFDLGDGGLDFGRDTGGQRQVAQVGLNFWPSVSAQFARALIASATPGLDE